MEYEIPSLNFYLETVAERMDEDTADVQSFCMVLEALIFGGEFQLSWDIDPNTPAIEAGQFTFDVIPPDFPEESIRFFIGVTDKDTAERLWADPYYLDITTWLDDSTLTDMGIEYTFETENHAGETYDIRIIKDQIGLYTDPCRPSTWIVTPEYLGENIDTISIKEVTLEILEKWKTYLVSNPEKVQPLKPAAKKNPFKLVSLNGKLV